MKSNFYEKLILKKDTKRKKDIEELSILLDESINKCMAFREQQRKIHIKNQINNIFTGKISRGKSTLLNCLFRRNDYPNSFLEFIE